jgi:hypothetical protein
MRRVEQLIAQSRRATENQEFTESAGVQDEEFIQYLNDAQEDIQTIIQGTFPNIMLKEEIGSLISGQGGYDIPRDCFLGTRINQVEVTLSTTENFYVLRKASLRERINFKSGSPVFWIRNGSQFLLQPAPQASGQYRVTYQRTIPTLDIRRGTVDSVTFGAGNTIASLILKTDEPLDDQALIEQNFITIVDKNGSVKMQGIPVTDVSASTGTVTIEAGFVFEDGETIEAGDYALRGAYSTTNSQLPDICEKFLLEYCNTRILMRDSSADSVETGTLMAKIQETLRLAFAEPDADPDRITILDTQFLGLEDFYP